MKIRANFVNTPWRWQLVASIAATIGLSFSILAALLWLDMRTVKSEEVQLERRLAKVSTQLHAAPRIAIPDMVTRNALQAKVEMLNRQAAAKGWPAAQLLVWLEEQAPADVHFVSIHHKTRDGEALLIAESASANSLTEFLRQLEQEPAFAEVLLSKQGGRAASADSLRFEIRVRLAP
jgi:hypothetical protein